jgi:hypothetical protein
MFDALHRRHKASAAMLYAFDLLEFDGEDLRPLVRKCRRKKVVLGTVLLQRMGQEVGGDGRRGGVGRDPGARVVAAAWPQERPGLPA